MARPSGTGREERLKAALKANIARRKAQARARTAAAAAKEAGATTPDTVHKADAGGAAERGSGSGPNTRAGGATDALPDGHGADNDTGEADGFNSGQG